MFPTDQAVFITATGTPIDANGNLIGDSFVGHLEHHLAHGIDGLLISGSMGMMPALTFDTWLESARVAARTAHGRAKIMVGVGDNSVERTRQRIEALRGTPIDAVVATTPFYFMSEQDDLIHYYTMVADMSPFPLYLYDLPQITKVKIELSTMLELSKHPNIHGAKCSHNPLFVRKVADAVEDRPFEIISAQFDLIDMFLHHGLLLQLDGFFCLMPEWLAQIKTAHAKGCFQTVTKIQRQMTDLREAFLPLGIFPAFTVAMNLLGFEGSFHPSHMRPLDKDLEPRVKQLLTDAGLV
jgi:4-hydroxy-tetrahydrodipicolinate synthase